MTVIVCGFRYSEKKRNLSEGSSDTFAFLMLLIEQKGIIWMRVSIFILIYAKLWDIFEFIANITGRKQYKYFFNDISYFAI